MNINNYIIFLLIFIISSCSTGKHSTKKGVKALPQTVVEQEFGKKLTVSILEKYKLSRDRKLQNYVNKLGAGIVAYIGREEINYYFAVLETAEVNSFAAPGGYVFITTGALKLMSNEAQLIGALTHEIVHVNHQDLVQELKLKPNYKKYDGRLKTAIGKNDEEYLKTMDKAVDILTKSGMRNLFEIAADKEVTRVLLSLGYSTRSYKKFLSAVAKDKNVGGISETHPPVKNRIKNINKVIRSAGNIPSLKIRSKRFKDNVRI